MTAEKLIAKVPNLPAPAPSVARLLQVLARPDADTDDVICIVKQDGVLSAKVLAFCNSTTFGLATSVGSIEQAVFYLGFSEIHRLVMLISFGAALSPSLPGYVIEDGELWRHSLVTAYATDKILRVVPTANIDPSIAYTAGLIHDIGKVVISHALNNQNQEQLRQIVQRGDRSLLEAEREVLGTDHAEIGACLLRQWRLPDNLVEAVAHHHAPPVQPRPQLSAIVHVADIIAHESGSSPGIDSYAVRPDEAAIAALGLGPVAMEKILVETLEALEEVKGMLSLA